MGFGARVSQAVAVLRRNTLHGRLAKLERESHGNRATYVGDNRVLVKCIVNGQVIAYYVEADDRLLAPRFIITGTYESYLTRYLVKVLRPDSHCIDVGANFGYFTCLMARFCPRGRVIGIEADQRVHALLRDNIAINGFSNARAIHAAAGDADGDVKLYRRHTRSGNTSIVALGTDYTDHMAEPPVEPFAVRGVRIDDLLEGFGGRVDTMKIDVEGAEPLVFAGAARTIADNPRLTIVMEWSPGQVQAAGFDVGDFVRSLAASGLRATDFVRGRRVSTSHDTLAGLPYRPGIVLRR